MARRRRRSTRSYVLEFALVLVAIAAVFAWMNLGGPEAFGSWMAERMAPPT